MLTLASQNVAGNYMRIMVSNKDTQRSACKLEIVECHKSRFLMVISLLLAVHSITSR